MIATITRTNEKAPFPAARRPTGAPFQERKTSKLGKGSSEIAGMVSALAEHPL